MYLRVLLLSLCRYSSCSSLLSFHSAKMPKKFLKEIQMVTTINFKEYSMQNVEMYTEYTMHAD